MKNDQTTNPMNQPITDRTFAYSTDTVKNSRAKNRKVSFAELASIVSTQEHHLHARIKQVSIDGLNNGIDPKQVKKELAPLKIQLPFFLFSGYQPQGHKNSQISYNGCIQIDIDFKKVGGDKEAMKVKEKISELPYIALAGISPSGVGVKALVATNNFDKKRHNEVSRQVIQAISKALLVEAKYFDNVGASQPVYAFFDADTYVNANAEVFEYKEEAVKTKAKGIARLHLGVPTVKAVNTSRTIAQGLTIATEKANAEVEDFSTPWLQHYIGCTISFGIAQDVAFNHLYTLGLEDRISEKTVAQFPDMYARYAANFGTIQIEDAIATKAAQAKKEYYAEYQLDGKKLSQLNIELPKKAIIVSPTGSGKTTFFALMDAKKILVVPTQSQVLQVAQDHRATPYYELNKEISDFIVTTPQSLIGLSQNIDVNEYMIIKDEAHNATVSASASFILKEEREVADLLAKHPNYYAITATPVENYHPAYQIPVIKVHGTKNIDRKFNFGTYKERDAAAAEFYHSATKAGYFPTILFNNTKEKLDSMVASINDLGYEPTLINAQKKLQDDYIEVTIDGKIGKDVDGLITTTVIKEGINIIEHPKKVAIAVFGDFAALELEQYAARFRSATHIILTIFKPESYEGQVSNFNGPAMAASLLDRAEYLAPKAEAAAEPFETSRTYDRFVKEIVRTYNSHNGHLLYIDDKDAVNVDLVSISHLVYEAEKVAQNKDLEFLASEFSKYGWKKAKAKATKAVDSKELKATKKALKAAKKEQLEADQLELLATIVEEGDRTNDEKLDGGGLEKWEQEIRFKVSYLTSVHFDSLEDATEFLKEIGFTTRNWSNFKAVENIEYHKLNNPEFLPLKKVYNAFKVGDKVTSIEVKTKLCKALSEAYGYNVEMTPTKATQVLNSFFTTKVTSVREGDKTSRAVEIEGTYKYQLFNKVDTTVEFLKAMYPEAFKTETCVF